MTSLREELLGGSAAMPEFRLLLPAGWQASPLDARFAERAERDARAVFVRAGRPDLDGAVTAQLQRGIAAARERGAKYVILPTEPLEDGPLPMSILVSTVDAPPGGTLDGWVADRIRKGATMLDATGRIVSWRTDRLGEGEESGTRQWQSHYVIPVPGSGRRRALLLTGSLLTGADDDGSTPSVVAAHAVFDAIVSTLSWVERAAAPVAGAS